MCRNSKMSLGKWWVWRSLVVLSSTLPKKPVSPKSQSARLAATSASTCLCMANIHGSWTIVFITLLANLALAKSPAGR
jgi:hypothetical protein